MNNYVPEHIVSIIRNHDHFLLAGHEKPDGDCIGSSLALSLFLQRLGKTATLLSPGPFSRFEIQAYRTFFSTTVPKQLPQRTIAVVLDSSTPERLGQVHDELTSYEMVVIDHHASGNRYGTYTFIDPTAPSVTFMIQQIIEALGYTPTAEEAHYLLFGLCTDTGFFRHLTADSSTVFHAVARLTAAGADPNRIYALLYGNRPLQSHRLLGTLLSRTESYFGGKLLITYERRSDFESGDPTIRNSDTLYLLLQNTAGVEAVVLLQEDSTTEVSVGLRSGGSQSGGLRSSSAIDVGKIAEKSGGGGHKKAAGFTFKGTISETREYIVELFTECFQGLPP